MSEPAPNSPWSLARVARHQAEDDLGIWTAEAAHSQSFHTRSEIDAAIQHVLADGYEPFRVTQDGSYHCIWFKVRLPSISATP